MMLRGCSLRALDVEVGVTDARCARDRLIGRDTWQSDTHPSHPPQIPKQNAIPTHLRAETALLTRASSEFFSSSDRGPKRMPSFDLSVPQHPPHQHNPRSPSLPPPSARPTGPRSSPHATRALSLFPAPTSPPSHILHLHSLHLPWTHAQCIRRAPSPGGRPCERLGWKDEMEYALGLVDHARLVCSSFFLSCPGV